MKILEESRSFIRVEFNNKIINVPGEMLAGEVFYVLYPKLITVESNPSEKLSEEETTKLIEELRADFAKENYSIDIE